MKRLAALIAAVLLLAADADAAFVTYTETATVVGTVGGTSFSRATLVLTQTSNTSDVSQPDPSAPIYYVPAITSTFSLTGGDLATPLSGSFTGQTFTFSNGESNYGGLAASMAFGDVILGDFSTAFHTYDLRSSLDPATGLPGYRQGTSFATTLGDLNITRSGMVTFQAVVTSAVPEPASLAMLGLGLVGVGGVARMRRRA